MFFVEVTLEETTKS